MLRKAAEVLCSLEPKNKRLFSSAPTLPFSWDLFPNEVTLPYNKHFSSYYLKQDRPSTGSALSLHRSWEWEGHALHLPRAIWYYSETGHGVRRSKALWSFASLQHVWRIALLFGPITAVPMFPFLISSFLSHSELLFSHLGICFLLGFRFIFVALFLLFPSLPFLLSWLAV